MQLKQVRIENFKLLEKVTVDFSTDPKKPLTAIRAENGSGKTSLLSAMLWGFYGKRGLPAAAQDRRLSSWANQPGKTVRVQVMIDFDHDGPGGHGRYRLVRSVDETTQGIEDVKRGSELLDVYRITSSGQEAIPNSDVFLSTVVPVKVRDLFFTNGDDVQEFMSGKVNRVERQDKVHQAIKSLLGLDQFYTARQDLQDAKKRFGRELSQSGGAELAEAQRTLDEADAACKQLQEECEKRTAEIRRIRDRKHEWEQELRSFNDIGDLTRINAELTKIETEDEKDERTQSKILLSIRSELESERLSWAMISPELDKGMAELEELADAGIIPGTSIEVIRDRLEEGICFCGTTLDEDSEPRTRLEHILSQHNKIDENQEILTAALHNARYQKSSYEAEAQQGMSFSETLKENARIWSNVSAQISNRKSRRELLEEQRRNIDADRVKTLQENIDAATADLTKKGQDQAVDNNDLAREQKKCADAEAHLAQLEKKAKLSAKKKANFAAVSDLTQLVTEIVRDLEEDHVQRVATMMSDRFLEIVGSDPEIDSAVFGSVSINDDFDIEVRTPQGARLDFDAEINGASQRALTLSFIWALMEVAQFEAPRMIDTPLGMVAGAVKRRLTEAITSPPKGGAPNFQVVLFLTRSEIRDIEDIIDQRAGLIRTMTCSKDQKDLAYPWGKDKPQVAVCACTHRQSCRICARTYDVEGEIEFRDQEEFAQ